MWVEERQAIADREEDGHLHRHYGHSHDDYHPYYVTDDIPGETEPISYMKHDGKRHKKLLRERRGDGKGKGKGKKLAKKAKKFAEENPEKAKRIMEKVQEEAPKIAEKVTYEVKERREGKERREKLGAYEHYETKYPKGYEGPQIDKPDKSSKRTEKEKKKVDDRHEHRPSTWYPHDYTPPRIDEDPNNVDLEQPVAHFSHPRAPMVPKHERPVEQLHHAPVTHESAPAHG